MKEVEKKLYHLQEQLERWIRRSAYFLPNGDVRELYQTVQGLESVRKDLSTIENSEDASGKAVEKLVDR
jgi:hypothetical protein